MSAGSPEGPVRIAHDHRGRVFLSFSDAVRPRELLGVLRSRFGAVAAGREEDPLGDWVDLRLVIGGHEVELTSENWGTWLCASDQSGSDYLKKLAPALGACLLGSSQMPTQGPTTS